MTFFKHLTHSALAASLLFTLTAHADSQTDQAIATARETIRFTQWQEVAEFIEQMATRHGFDRAELKETFNNIEYVEKAIQLMKPAPPGQPKNWKAYRDRFVEPFRINAGAEFWEAHADALKQAEERFGVPAEIIVGIIGVETVYGRHTGNFRVMDALATLAFDYPDTPTRETRMRFFRGELENTLLLARDAKINPFSLSGSYAGAIGWPQFMPGSIRRYAVDFDGDGRINLRDSPVDAIGSVANFLAQHGWKRGDPIVFPVTVSQEDSRWNAFINQGLQAKFSIGEIKAAGVSPTVEPPADMQYGLVDLQNGMEPTEYWLGTNNFFAITKYNRSFFYAMSVVDLGRAVRTVRSH